MGNRTLLYLLFSVFICTSAQASSSPKNCTESPILVSSVLFHNSIKNNYCYKNLEINTKRMIRLGILDSYASSAVMLSKNTKNGWGVFVMAAHSSERYQLSGINLNNDFFSYPSGRERNIPSYLLTKKNKFKIMNESFLFFRPASEEYERANWYAKLKVSNDFSLGFMTQDKYWPEDAPPNSKKINTEPLELGLSEQQLQQIEITEPKKGEAIYLLGYARAFGGDKLVISSGPIIPKDEIEFDPQSDYYTPYEKEAEFFVAAKTLSGMSGGGAFNSEGKLVGIILRSSTDSNLTYILKIDYTLKYLKDNYKKLSPEQIDLKNNLEPWLKALSH